MDQAHGQFTMTETDQGHTAKLQAIPDSDDLWAPIPDQILATEDWRTGDVLSVEIALGGIVLTNKTKQRRERPVPEAKRP